MSSNHNDDMERLAIGLPPKTIDIRTPDHELVQLLTEVLDRMCYKCLESTPRLYRDGGLWKLRCPNCRDIGHGPSLPLMLKMMLMTERTEKTDG